MDDRPLHPFILDGRTVAEYHWRPRLPGTLSPRPYLHPVRTLGGIAVTQASPADHPHHLGVSLAIPDVGGTNFWGGRTYVHGQGSLPLPNHGTQRHHRWEARTDTHLAHELHWTAPDGTVLLDERRRITAHPIDHRAWALDFRYTLRNRTTRPLTVSSPGAKGRTGAGYGGFFWRAPTAPAAVHGPGATGTTRLHGATTPWIAIATGGDTPWTLVLTHTHPDPWFIRAQDYNGAGPALAWTEPFTAAPGEGPQRRIIAVVADGTLTPHAIQGLVDTVTASPAPREA